MSDWINPFDNASIIHFDVLDSTMLKAEELIKSGERVVNGTTIVAEYQTAGRGRFVSRKWHSAKSKNLLFTSIFLIEEIPFPYIKMPLLLGWVVSSVLWDDYNLKTRIKWPNDIIITNNNMGNNTRIERVRKLGGILCEAKGRYLLAGIGINCNEDFLSGSPKLERAVSIKMLTGELIDVRSLLYALLKKMKREIFLNYNESLWVKRFNETLYGVGKVVRVIHFPGNSSSMGENLEGKIVGIANDGSLILRVEGEGNVKVTSGEIVGLY